ncbi:amylo-alpha-1,6-glucosidase [Tunturibacter empetritectus]|uniref:Amylo-alpha-1,6-glucosidase n=1 Tax=Tunturiibacter empetritectus TaxID=3069691 RepID=A0AAU7ZD81_9BACT
MPQQRNGRVVIKFDSNECSDLDGLKTKEWLVTNGLGGYASGTIASMNTRRYHGLLVASMEAPLGRLVLLSQLEDTLIVDGARFPLSTNLYSENIVHPSGYLNLVGFRLDPDPVFTYSNGGWEITRTVSMVQGQNTTIIEYALGKRGSGKHFFLEVRPLIAFRGYHAATHENQAINRWVDQGNGTLTLQPYQGLPKLHIAHDPAEVQVDGYWYREFEYEREKERGLDHKEDLFSPLLLTTSLDSENCFSLIASTELQPISRLAQYKQVDVARGWKSPNTANQGSGRSDLNSLLEKAAGQFTITRTPFTSTIAGYHWFGDWGRDTMISLPGLMLATGKHELAREILLHYVQFIDGGMLPNRFPDAGEQPEYNTVDATLWFFEAIRQYVAYENCPTWRSQATALLEEHLYVPLKEIIRFHVEGTRFGIHADEQGFLWAGDPSTQLTWMDAKDGDVAFTPRHGRPVEIQALWYNALRTIASFGVLLGDQNAVEDYNALADRLQNNFLRVFWNEQRGCLFDVARGEERDASLRPNQIFTVSLHYPLIIGKPAAQVIQRVEEELLTPYGLRTLSRDDHQYRGSYEGDGWSRDGAYHQGTVWPWLAGPFFFAKLAVSESPAATMSEIERWLDGFTPHLRDAGLGQVSEIFEGDHPFFPRGCIAQAWSVAEILRLASRVAAETPGDHE